MKLEGGCYCGQIRYNFEGEPQGSVQCHCRECQYITGGNPNLVMILPKSEFAFTQGEPKSFTRSDIDNAVTRHFCPNCGTAIGTSSKSLPDAIIIKVGTLDDASFYKPNMAIFTKDAQSFHHIPDDIPSFEGFPG